MSWEPTLTRNLTCKNPRARFPFRDAIFCTEQHSTDRPTLLLEGFVDEVTQLDHLDSSLNDFTDHPPPLTERSVKSFADLENLEITDLSNGLSINFTERPVEYFFAIIPNPGAAIFHHGACVNLTERSMNFTKHLEDLRGYRLVTTEHPSLRRNILSMHSPTRST